MLSVPEGCMCTSVCVCLCVSEWCNGGDGWRGRARRCLVCVCVKGKKKKVILCGANHSDRHSSSSIETEDNKETS